MMAASGGGAIVNTASIAGLNALVRPDSFADDPAMLESVSAYVGAKHGVVGITKQFAVAYASKRCSSQRHLPRLYRNAYDCARS